MRIPLALAALAIVLVTPTDRVEVERADAAQSGALSLARGFSNEASALYVNHASLIAAEGWIAKYEGEANGARLQKKLDSDLPTFLKEGDLVEATKP
jgi:hypothetical protein